MDRFKRTLGALGQPININQLGRNTNGINGYSTPDLKLSKDGLKEVKELKLAGRRHRIDAVRKIHDGLHNELAKAEKQTATLTKKKVLKASTVKRKVKDIQVHVAHEEAICNQLKFVS